CVLTFGLTAPYILLPVGFGQLFHQLLAENIEKSGLQVNLGDIPNTLLIPVLGMVAGLLFAIFISYRKPRKYRVATITKESSDQVYTKQGILFAVIAIIATVVIQVLTSSMVLGAFTGIIVLYVSGSVKWNEADSLLTQ